MIRATTPTHTFTFPDEVNPADCERILVTYTQGGEKVLELTEDDATVDGQDVKYTLTQEQTKLFSDFRQAKVQVRVLTVYGDALASDIIPFTVNPVLNDEVLT